MHDRLPVVPDGGAPAPIGPYTPGIVFGGVLHCSGQTPLDPTTGEVVGHSVAEQTRRCLDNLAAVCATAGTALDRAIKLTVYLTDMATFAEMNEVYGSYFATPAPARTTVGVAALPRGARVEIEAIVAVS